MPLEQRLDVVAQVADALHAAHDAGVIHRDVKPSNILIADVAGSPRAKLVDFGIGQVLSVEALAGLTKLGFTDTIAYTGSATGTLLYQAPELVRGERASASSDLYSLSVVLFQAVAGDFKQPVTADWEKAIDDPLLRADLARGLASNPTERFGSAAEFAANLRSIAERRKQVALREAAESQRVNRSNARRRMRRGLEIVAALCLLLLALWSVFRDDAAVEIITEPAGAEVWENGNKLGTTPFTKNHLKPGRLEYTIRADGFEELTYVRSLRARRFTSVQLPLTRLRDKAAIAFTGPGVIEKQGTVEVSIGNGRWIPVDVGKITLEYGDHIRTGERARAAIRLNDGSVLRIDELSHVQINAPPLKEQNGKRSIDLQRGGVYFFPREKTKDIEIKTPAANGVLRG